ncbi:MAG: DUF2071 domain-containing protein [Actinobacteria bacterium]|nr:DUF2071 domain-containing protein [Actinomycetota bacterium]
MAGRDPEETVPVPVAYQGWRRVAFLHWAYDPDAVRPLVPPELDLDLSDGSAWVSLTPFDVVGFHPPGLPALPGVSSFPETNLRTYVRGPDGRDGLWFLSLEVASAPTVAGARLAYGVPYNLARMQVEEVDDGSAIRYRSTRVGDEEVGHDLVVRPLEPLTAEQRTPFDDWLTGRWRAYGRRAGMLLEVSVAHQPWPLAGGRVEVLHETITAAVGLPPPNGEAVVHTSPGVDARLGPPRPVAAADGDDAG